MAKSYRTAFIRVTSENETEHDGTVIYTLKDLVYILDIWAESAGFTYWIIEHSADEEVSKDHFHIVIKFKTPTPFETIKNKFPFGKIENARNIKATVQYLIHLNDKSKKQYSWDDIKTNCKDMTPYKVQSNSQQEITIQGIMEAINSGKIREYNQFTEIPIELWAKYKVRIENALTYYRERICMDKDRNITVIFISGAAGLGKTTFAKDYCFSLKKSYSISSSSNDPLQDYKGEDVLILDDLREDSFKFHDFIKLLDNHTLSSSKSRYHNKPFIGDTIIITSVKPLQDWYFNETSEDKHQLYRRIQQMYKFTSDKFIAYEYNPSTFRYEPVCSAVNYITMKARERAQRAMNVFDAMGLELMPIDRKAIDNGINSYTNEEWDMLDKELRTDKNHDRDVYNEELRKVKKLEGRVKKLGSVDKNMRVVSGNRVKRTKKEVPEQ